MPILSVQFLAFAIVVIALYFLLPIKFRWVSLLLGNIVFYLYSGAWSFLYILTTSLITYIIALFIEKATQKGRKLLSEATSPTEKKAIKANTLKGKKVLCALAAVITLGIWIVLKYGNFLITNFNGILSVFNSGWRLDALDLLLPLGISYYTFHAVGYLVDVYRAKYPAERNFFRLFTFISFFPHIIQGPFSRYEQLKTTLFAGAGFSYDRFCAGLCRILWGVFKKLVIADKLGAVVLTVFSEYNNYSPLHIFLTIIIYSMQIYADFSGYMDIMCGFCKILGISLAENFEQPYFARSVDEFWRRWHITLGKWFKDYVFYPISMSHPAQKLGKWARGKFSPKMGKLLPGYLALVFVWSATGLWHGASWTYLIWGYLNLIIIMASMQLEDFYTKIKTKFHINSQSRWWNVFSIIRTFVIISLLRFFSYGGSFSTVASIIKHVFTTDNSIASIGFTLYFSNLSVKNVLVALFGYAIIFIVDLLKETNRWESAKRKCPTLLKMLIYAAMIFSIILFAGGDNDLIGGFLYANF